MLSNIVLVAVCMIAVIMVMFGGSVSPNLLGIAIVYAIQLTGFLQWSVRAAVEMENNMTAVERLLAFDNIIQEAPRLQEQDPSRLEWPSRGEVVIRNLSMRYRPDLDLVLKNVTVNIPAGSMCGICGRSGSGRCNMIIVFLLVA